MREVTCNNCGWVHMAVTRSYAVNQVKEFNDFYETLSTEYKCNYAGPASIGSYEKCFYCGGSYLNFREFKEGDCPDGVTIQPILHFTET